MDCYLQAHKIDKDKELFPNAHFYLSLYSRFLDNSFSLKYLLGSNVVVLVVCAPGKFQFLTVYIYNLFLC